VVDATPQMNDEEYTRSWISAIYERMDMRAAGDENWLRIGECGATALKECVRRSITKLRSMPKPKLP
jgi:sarcosine oxidase delta subunit